VERNYILEEYCWEPRNGKETGGSQRVVFKEQLQPVVY
jgi:hypothetical protein